MVAFREHYVIVIEPADFNIHKNFIDYTTFGFVLGSRDAQFQEYIIEQVIHYLELWQVNYKSAFLKNIKNEVSDFVHSTLRNNEITLHSLFAFGVLAYYIAVSQGKKMHLRYFSTSMNNSFIYYTYFGVNDYAPIDIISKIINNTIDLRQVYKRTFFYIYPKRLKGYTKLRGSKLLNKKVNIILSKKD
jgi:hypothetical protein